MRYGNLSSHVKGAPKLTPEFFSPGTHISDQNCYFGRQAYRYIILVKISAMWYVSVEKPDFMKDCERDRT